VIKSIEGNSIEFNLCKELESHCLDGLRKNGYILDHDSCIFYSKTGVMEWQVKVSFMFYLE
jgi:hypothetical protein